MDYLRPRLNYINYRKEHEASNRQIEIAACDVYIMVFKRCEVKFQKSKHVEFIKKWYADSCRLSERFGADGQIEDTFLQKLIQHALVVFWENLGLYKQELLNERYPRMRFSGTPMKYWPSGDY